MLSVKPDIPQRWMVAQNNTDVSARLGCSCFTTGEIRPGNVLVSNGHRPDYPDSKGFFLSSFLSSFLPLSFFFSFLPSLFFLPRYLPGIKVYGERHTPGAQHS